MLAVFLPPLALNRRTLDVFNLAKLWVVWVAGLLAALFWLAWSLERRVWVPRFNIGYAAAAFLTALALATAFSRSPLVSLLGRYHRYGGLIPIVLYVLIMLVLVGLYWEQPARMRGIVGGVAAASVAVAGYAIVQGAGLDPIRWALAGRSPSLSISTLGNPNFTGGYLAISLPLLTYLALSSTGLWRWAVIGACALSVLGMWFAGSEGGMVGAAAGMVTFAIFHRQRLKPGVKKAIRGVSSAALLLALLAIWHPGLEDPPAVLRGLDFTESRTAAQRLSFWRAGLKNFADHPLLGTGPDTFYSVYGRYRGPADDMITVLVDKPHNILVEYASNTGILGLGAYLFLAGVALRYAIKAVRRPDHPHRDLLVAFVSSFVAYLAQGFFSIDVPPLAFMGWVTVGAIAVLADPKLLAARTVRDEIIAAKLAKGKRKGKDRPDEGSLELVAAENGALARQRARVVQASAAGLTVALVIVGARPVMADSRARVAAVWEQEAKASRGAAASLERAVIEIEEAMRLNPLEGSYQQSAAGLLLQQAGNSTRPEERELLFRKAGRLLHRADEIERDNVYYAMSLGRFYARWARVGDLGRFETAAIWWRKAFALDPENWQVSYHYGAFLNEWGVITERPSIIRASIPVLQKAADSRPHLPYLWRALGQSYLALEDKQSAQKALGRALTISPKDPVALRLMARAKTG